MLVLNTYLFSVSNERDDVVRFVSFTELTTCLFLEPLVFWLTRGERAGSPSGTGDQGPGREAASAEGEDGD